jgi:indole-3-glycerol phosphate synthase
LLPTILRKIVEHKRHELSLATLPLTQLEQAAEASISCRRDFRAALAQPRPAIIAECKKASPSKGVMLADYDAPRIARMYESGGASALSVLTDERFFQGSLADLAAARAACGLPVLRKDFTIDERHVLEAAAGGADAILLIAAILDTRDLRRFRELAAGFAMAALVEVHDSAELASAVDSGADIIGVNSRNLHDFTVSLDTALGLAERIPSAALRVAESGIHSRSDVVRLMDAGYQAFLVGERLMTAPDPVAALRSLRA